VLQAHQRYLRLLTERYGALFCGDAQVLSKLKSTVSVMGLSEKSRPSRNLLKAKSVAAFCEAVERLTA
jgi:hypothetical protein